ncbi:hypothetical protein [Thiothrix winogradskyi]|uniref:Uncharacterized protein n=1 Tax=Thiothrix winogradskyi TaxID=96472 RepID=A0ABY3T2H8_9GAMM|nr:hypothetical protein [Thiothrix winogradskyi]UJS26062.1 hypothetical protein L2Y54_08485 [Thiothrix winogradskyi]
MFLKWFLGLPAHLRIAIILAPFIAIGGYGLTDLWITKNQPKQAAPISMEALQLQGECWLATNQCALQNARMKVALVRKDASQPGLVRLEIFPDTNIRGIEMSLVQAGEEHLIVVKPNEGGGAWPNPESGAWFVEFPEKLLTPSPSVLRIALAKFGSVAYAEIQQPQF